MTSEQVAQVAEKVAPYATFGGGGSALVFGLSPSEWSVLGVIGGLVIGIAGWVTQVYFKRQHLKIARQRAQADAEQ